MMIDNRSSNKVSSLCNFPRNIAERAKAIDDMSVPGLGRERCATLLDRYGSRAAKIAKHCAAIGDVPLSGDADYSQPEIGFIFQNELTGRLADVVFRRTDIALSGRLNPEVAREIAMIGAQALGWDARRVTGEISDVSHIAHSRHRIAGFDRCAGTEREGCAETRDLKTTERQ